MRYIIVIIILTVIQLWSHRVRRVRWTVCGKKNTNKLFEMYSIPWWPTWFYVGISDDVIKRIGRREFRFSYLDVGNRTRADFTQSLRRKSTSPTIDAIRISTGKTTEIPVRTTEHGGRRFGKEKEILKKLQIRLRYRYNARATCSARVAAAPRVVAVSNGDGGDGRTDGRRWRWCCRWRR